MVTIRVNLLLLGLPVVVDDDDDDDDDDANSMECADETALDCFVAAPFVGSNLAEEEEHLGPALIVDDADHGIFKPPVLRMRGSVSEKPSTPHPNKRTPASSRRGRRREELFRDSVVPKHHVRSSFAILALCSGPQKKGDLQQLICRFISGNLQKQNSNLQGRPSLHRNPTYMYVDLAMYFATKPFPFVFYLPELRRSTPSPFLAAMP